MTLSFQWLPSCNFLLGKDHNFSPVIFQTLSYLDLCGLYYYRYIPPGTNSCSSFQATLITAGGWKSKGVCGGRRSMFPLSCSTHAMGWVGVAGGVFGGDDSFYGSLCKTFLNLMSLLTLQNQRGISKN